MNFGKKFKFGIAIFFLAVCGAKSVYAELNWYRAVVHQVGPSVKASDINSKLVLIQMSDGSTNNSFENKWFTAVKTAEKEMLAMAMTALSLGKQLSVYTDLDAPFNPTIYIMLLRDE